MPRRRTTIPSLAARVRRANRTITGTSRRADTIAQRARRAVRVLTGSR